MGGYFPRPGENVFDPMKPRRWRPPRGWQVIDSVDSHAAGEPLRIFFGFPELPGATILARRRYARAHWDHLRKALMWEPRGHADMYGCIVTAPVSRDAAFGVLFLHNEGFSTMCGHGIIAVTTAVLELGLLPKRVPETVIGIDTPAGLVTAYARVAGTPRRPGPVLEVRFRNVPSFVVALDQSVAVPNLGPVRYDLAFGGAFYAYVQAGDLGLRCQPDQARTLIDTGMAIARAVTATRPVVHPFEADLNFLYGTIFIAPPQTADIHSRNVCIFAEGEVDRSPTGTGVSGRMALHHARGEVGLDETLTIESIIGSRFTGKVVETLTFGGLAAVIPEVGGQAYLTGRHQFFLDPEDPFRHGFLIR